MKLKGLLKVALVLLAISTMFVACDTLVGGIFPVMYESEPGKLYLLPSGAWAKGDERYAAYFWKGTSDNITWVDMVAKESDPYTEGIYEVTIPEDVENVIFVRMNGETTENNWDNKWDQTEDLKIPTDGKVLFDTASWKLIASASADNIGDIEEEPEEPAKTVNDLTCYAGSMNGWNPAEQLVDGSFTFYAKGGDTFKFTAGAWDIFEAAGVVIDALDTKIELETAVKGLDNIKFADDILTVNAEYKVTLIIEDGKAFVKVEATGNVYTPPANCGIKYTPEAGKVYVISSDWDKDGAVIAAWIWGDDKAGVWKTMTRVEGQPTLLELDVTGYDNVIFRRFGPDQEIGWGDADWGGKTGDLVLPTDNKVVAVISGWTRDGSVNVEWLPFAE